MQSMSFRRDHARSILAKKKPNTRGTKKPRLKPFARADYLEMAARKKSEMRSW